MIEYLSRVNEEARVRIVDRFCTMSNGVPKINPWTVADQTPLAVLIRWGAPESSGLRWNEFRNQFYEGIRDAVAGADNWARDMLVEAFGEAAVALMRRTGL